MPPTALLNRPLVACFVSCVILAFPLSPRAQEPVSFLTTAGESVRGEIQGAGGRGVVVVAHGGYSSIEAWRLQAQTIAAAGFRVLVFETRAGAELRETGKETDCLYDPACMALDVLAAVRYFREAGAMSIYVMAGSAGGGAAAHASVASDVGEIDGLVLLAPMVIENPDRMKGRKLVITTRDDSNSDGPRLPGIQQQFDRAPEPKRLLVLEGSAHAQRIFETPAADVVMQDILRFLSEP
jgi:dienelactone hydrolase